MQHPDLFLNASTSKITLSAPLSERMRPHSLDEFYGQNHLIGEGRILKRMIENNSLSSLILWGPPGCGKTTLAHVIATETKAHFIFFSAILSGVKEIREIFREAEELRHRNIKTVLFVDEIHRFNKSQQDAFLPYVEKGVVTLIGATTENPSFEVIPPLLSRCRVLTLKPLESSEIEEICQRALSDPERGLGKIGAAIHNDALEILVERSGGDARRALNALEVASNISNLHISTIPETGCCITIENINEALQQKTLVYDKGGEEHYNVISAFIKSMRASDPDAAIYWCARMLEAGEDPLFILRRMIIFASEDVGNADPRALQVALSAFDAFRVIGMPEGRIIIGQGVTYLATAPKSNASYKAINEALAEVRRSGNLDVPLHIRNAPTGLMKDLGYGKGYQYPHDYENAYSGQSCLPEALLERKFYTPQGYGYEKNIKERMEWLQRKKVESR